MHHQRRHPSETFIGKFEITEANMEIFERLQLKFIFIDHITENCKDVQLPFNINFYFFFETLI